jgi:hypothetical protein
MAADPIFEYKMQFAVLLQRVPKDKRQQYAVEIVKRVVGKEDAAKYTSWVLQTADDWMFDPDVIAEIDRLDSIKKTPEQLLQQAWDFVINSNWEPRDRVLALRLYCESIGMVGSKSGTKGEATENATVDKLTQLFNAAKPQ